jgi:RNA 3'-terminal phosphate cyclase (ATP)
LRLRVQPSALRPLHLVERGPLRGIGAEVLLAGLPRHVGERELDQVRERFAPGDAALKLHQLGNQHPPANLLTLYAHCGRHCETVIAHGALGKRAEAVGQAACAELAAYLDSGAAVGEHLADQLLLPALLGGGGSYTTHVASSHLRSNAHTLEQMGVAEVSIDPCAGGNWRIEVRPG